MRLMSSATAGQWADLEAVPASGEEKQREASQHMASLDQILRDVLLSEHLMVLCGLGTSLCVTNSEGTHLAPKMGDLWQEAREAAGGNLEDILDDVSYSVDEHGEDIEYLLSNCQLWQRLRPQESVAEFIRRAEERIVARCRFLPDGAELPVHEGFLRKVARRPTRKPRMQLFTTNYDLCFETAASRTRFVVIDGFSHTQPQEFDGSYFNYDLVRREREAPDFITNVFHLYKIHGSLDWSLREGRVVRDPAAARPLIIYPRHSKYELSFDQPFLEMMSRLQIGLRQPNTGLVVVGFGFNDHHIAQPLVSAVTSNVGLRMLVVDPSLENSNKTQIQTISSLIREGDTRLALLAGGFEDLTKLLPDLVAPMDEERHAERVRRIGGGG